MSEQPVIKVQWRERDDSFTIEIDRHLLNMLQRAIQSSPYEEVKGMRREMIRALLNQPGLAHHPPAQ